MGGSFFWFGVKYRICTVSSTGSPTTNTTHPEKKENIKTRMYYISSEIQSGASAVYFHMCVDTEKERVYETHTHTHTQRERERET